MAAYAVVITHSARQPRGVTLDLVASVASAPRFLDVCSFVSLSLRRAILSRCGKLRRFSCRLVDVCFLFLGYLIRSR